MKKRLTEEQIIGFLREAEAGVAVKEPCRRHGFSEASYDLCRSKYDGMSVPEAKCLRASYCRPQTLAAIPRKATCGLAPLASHRAMNWGGTSTSRTLDGWNCGLGLDMTDLRFARQPLWPPLASPNRIAHRRVKVCVVRTTGPRGLDLDAPSTMRHWDGNGGRLETLL